MNVLFIFVPADTETHVTNYQLYDISAANFANTCEDKISRGLYAHFVPICNNMKCMITDSYAKIPLRIFLLRLM